MSVAAQQAFTQQTMMPIVVSWAVPLSLTLSVVTLALSRTGFSPQRFEALLAKSSLSELHYARAALAVVALYRLMCLSPLVFLAALGADIIRKVEGGGQLGTCILLVGPSLLLLLWAGLRAKCCAWHLSWWPVAAAMTGAMGLLAAQLTFAIAPSTPFLSFSAVFLGLSALPVALMGELGIGPEAVPLLSLGAVAGFGVPPAVEARNTEIRLPGSAAAAPPIHRQRVALMAGAAYITITAAYALVGILRRDVAPYAAAAAAACVLVFDALAIVLHLQGAIRGGAPLLLLCATQRLVFVAFGPDYIDEGEAVVFMLVGVSATHRLIRSRWVKPPTTALDRYLADLICSGEATVKTHANANFAAATETLRGLRARLAPFSLELFTAAVCLTHLLLLLLLVLLLPSGALPPARLLGSQHSQPLSGLLALSVLAGVSATDALLTHWLLRGARPLSAWLAWWAFIVVLAALVDTLLIRSFGLLIFTAFAGPILLCALHGHRSWAEDAYCFVESWAEVKSAWAGTTPTMAVTKSKVPRPSPKKLRKSIKKVETMEDMETVSATADPPPSPPPSPTGPPASAQEAGVTITQAEATSPMASLQAWLATARDGGNKGMKRVQASRVLQRLVSSALLAMLHVGLGGSLSVALGSTGWAVAMALSIVFLCGIAVLSNYHQPERRILPAVCISLALLIHILFCIIFWRLVVIPTSSNASSSGQVGVGATTTTGDESSGESSGEVGSGAASASPPDATLTAGSALLLYAVGAPTAVAFVGLVWVWFDSGWKVTRPIQLAMGSLGGLLLAFVLCLAVAYSWQLAFGLLLAIVTLVASSAAAVTWQVSGGYLPRGWYFGLGSLYALLATIGAVIALINPYNGALTAVNGFVGCSLSWWSIMIVVFAAGVAKGLTARGESYRYYHLTVVPSFRFMGRHEPLQNADTSIILYSMAGLGVVAWSAIAAVTFQPAGLGTCVGVAAQLAWMNFVMHCIVAPLRELGQLAPFMSAEVLAAAASAVRAEATKTAASGGGLGPAAGGVDGELDALAAARLASEAGLALAVAARDSAQRQLGVFDGCRCRPLSGAQSGTSADGTWGGPDDGRTAGRDLEQGRGATDTDSSATTTRAVGLDGVSGCCALPKEARARRLAAAELPRLDDAVAASWSANIQVLAKFHAVLVSSLVDARAAHERSVRAFLLDTLRAREQGAEAGEGSSRDDASLEALLSPDRMQHLTRAQRKALEGAAKDEEMRQAAERRRKEFEAAKKEALYSAQERLRQLGGRRDAMTKRLTGQWKETLGAATAALEGQRRAIAGLELSAAQLAADGVQAELEALAAAGEATAAAACAEPEALAYATHGAGAQLDGFMAQVGALGSLAEGQRSAEIFARVVQEMGEAVVPDSPSGAPERRRSWLPEGEQINASMAHLPPELRLDADVRAAHIELLKGSELCRRAEGLAAAALAEVEEALRRRAAEIGAELAAARARLADAKECLQRERTRLAEVSQAALRQRAEAERGAIEAQKRRAEEERRRRRELEAAEAEAARASEREEEARRRAEVETRSPREAALVEAVEPRLADVRRARVPYTDSDFPASGTRLLPPSVRGTRGVGWTRAQRIYGARQTLTLFGDDGEPDPDEICQGSAGDCWFLSALSILAMRPDLVRQIVVTPEVLPLEPGGRASGEGGESAGLFCVTFYKDGAWRPVVVDDHFPTDGRGSHLFARSRGSELWVSVLEKAYASLHGSYTAIEGGWIEDALCDLTGGIKISGPRIDPTAHASLAAAWKELEGLAREGNYLLGASTVRAPDGGGDTHATRGIVHGHAYALLDVVTVEPEGQRLLKLRNPWGQTEWEGKFGDADMARPHNARLRKKLGWTGGDDGAFWMGFDDFVQFFNSISICMLPQGWACVVAHGEWRAGATAGGCPNFESVTTNPQFVLSISRPADIVLTLTQTDRRMGAGQDDWNHAPIGMYVCYLGKGGFGTRPSRMASRHDIQRNKVASTGTFHGAREATIKVSLAMRDHGTTSYIVLPCTFDPGVEASFTLRAFVAEGQPAVELLPAQ